MGRKRWVGKSLFATMRRTVLASPFSWGRTFSVGIRRWRDCSIGKSSRWPCRVGHKRKRTVSGGTITRSVVSHDRSTFREGPVAGHVRGHPPVCRHPRGRGVFACDGVGIRRFGPHAVAVCSIVHEAGMIVLGRAAYGRRHVRRRFWQRRRHRCPRRAFVPFTKGDPPMCSRKPLRACT